ncbi:MAG: hypothetical protein N0A00_01385, partial [Candidatus Bathyarchaeota archaeon]|nr:hypothetical protein [Candidatus Bathyarchaeota archaeon]
MVEVKTIKMFNLLGEVVELKVEKEKRNVKENGHVGPWEGVCCEACWFAKEEKCVCKCGGRNHGRGLTGKYEKLEDFLVPDLFEANKLLE